MILITHLDDHPFTEHSFFSLCPFQTVPYFTGLLPVTNYRSGFYLFRWRLLYTMYHLLSCLTVYPFYSSCIMYFFEWSDSTGAQREGGRLTERLPETRYLRYLGIVYGEDMS